VQMYTSGSTFQGRVQWSQRGRHRASQQARVALIVRAEADRRFVGVLKRKYVSIYRNDATNIMLCATVAREQDSHAQLQYKGFDTTQEPDCMKSVRISCRACLERLLVQTIEMDALAGNLAYLSLEELPSAIPEYPTTSHSEGYGVRCRQVAAYRFSDTSSAFMIPESHLLPISLARTDFSLLIPSYWSGTSSCQECSNSRWISALWSISTYISRESRYTGTSMIPREGHSRQSRQRVPQLSRS
jgi:hypothetical protein